MRCRVKYTCGHSGVVYLDGTMERIYRRMDLFSRMRCDDCRNAAGCKLVVMRYADYQNHFAICRTKPDSYNADFKTISVYVPADYETNGSTGIDRRAEEVQAAIQMVQEQHASSIDARLGDALTKAAQEILAYLRQVPMVSAYTAAYNAWLAAPADYQYGNSPHYIVYKEIIKMLE